MKSTRRGSFSVHRSEKKPQVPKTARQAASLPGDISRGKRSSMPQPKTRPDSPVPSLQGTLRSESEIRGTLRFLPQLDMSPSSNAPSPVESREAPPTSSFPDVSGHHHEKPPEVTCTSRGNPGFPASTRESPRETFFNTSRGQSPLPWLGSNDALPLATRMETRLPWRPTRGSLTSPSYLARNRTLGPPLENNPEIPPSSRDEGLRLLHGLATNLATSLQTPQEA